MCTVPQSSVALLRTKSWSSLSIQFQVRQFQVCQFQVRQFQVRQTKALYCRLSASPFWFTVARGKSTCALIQSAR